MKLIYLIIPFIVGTFLPLQGGINNLLSKELASPLPAAFASFLGGTLAIGVVLLFSKYQLPVGHSFKAIPMHYWIGGLLGAMFVTSVIYIAPVTGIVSFLSISLAGQFFMGLIVDHYGLLGIAKNEINLGKIAGIGTIFIGAYIIQYFK